MTRWCDDGKEGSIVGVSSGSKGKGFFFRRALVCAVKGRDERGAIDITR